MMYAGQVALSAEKKAEETNEGEKITKTPKNARSIRV